ITRYCGPLSTPPGILHRTMNWCAGSASVPRCARRWSLSSCGYVPWTLRSCALSSEPCVVRWASSAATCPRRPLLCCLILSTPLNGFSPLISRTRPTSGAPAARPSPTAAPPPSCDAAGAGCGSVPSRRSTRSYDHLPQSVRQELRYFRTAELGRRQRAAPQHFPDFAAGQDDVTRRFVRAGLGRRHAAAAPAKERVLEAHGLNPQLGRGEAVEDVLRVVRPVVVAHTRVIAAHDDMGAAVVLVHQRV